VWPIEGAPKHGHQLEFIQNPASNVENSIGNGDNSTSNGENPISNGEGVTEEQL